MSDSPFAPPGESAYDLWVERSNLNGMLRSGVAYGILFTVAFQTIVLFLQLPKARIPWGLVAYTTTIFVLASLGVSTNAKFNEMTYIDDRNIPGGPNAYTVQFYASVFPLTSFASYTVMSWFADGLVLWRFIMLFGYKYWLGVLPLMMFMGSIASSIALLVSMTKSSDTFWSSKSMQFSIAYWSLSISLNIILTLSIITRIWSVRHRVQKLLGSHHSGQYVSITAILVESAALYSGWGLVFLICYARNTPFQNILLPPLGQVQGIAPLLILFRVAQGRAWSQNTVTVTSTQVSAPSGGNNSIALTNLTSNGEGSRNTERALKVNMTTDSDVQWDGNKSSNV
ncbi:hypothetical protein C8R43DRAFT_1076079, partial [Mycena crocata]